MSNQFSCDHLVFPLKNYPFSQSNNKKRHEKLQHFCGESCILCSLPQMKQKQYHKKSESGFLCPHSNCFNLNKKWIWKSGLKKHSKKFHKEICVNECQSCSEKIGEINQEVTSDITPVTAQSSQDIPTLFEQRN